MMMSVDPGTAAAGIPSVMSMAVQKEDIDPTKPNDHPILKVHIHVYYMDSVHIQQVQCLCEKVLHVCIDYPGVLV